MGHLKRSQASQSRFPRLCAVLLLLVSFAIQGGLQACEDNHPEHDVHCGCAHVDKIEWSLDAACTEFSACTALWVEDDAEVEALHPVSLFTQRARAPPIV